VDESALVLRRVESRLGEAISVIIFEPEIDVRAESLRDDVAMKAW
jgi:hypothetical protein